MRLVDHFAKLLSGMGEISERRLADAEAVLKADPPNLLAMADRLTKGEEADRLLEELSIRYPEDAARIATAQAIDHCFGPTVTPYAHRQGRNPEAALSRATPHLNTDGRQGWVLTAATLDGELVADVADLASPPELRAFFDHLVYLRPYVRAAHPDREGTTSELLPVRVAGISYNDTVAYDLDEPIRVGYIPLAEQEHDIGFRFSTRGERCWYHVDPRPRTEQLLGALECLVKSGAHLIVVPETSAPLSALPAVSGLLAGLADYPGNKVRAVIAGLAELRGEDGSRPQNLAVVLDRRGREIGRQHKLTRWNIGASHIARYKLDDLAPPGVTTLYEDIDQGKEMVVFDLPGLGRTVIHICADMQAAEPANSIRRAIWLDWSISPLMDASLEFDKANWAFKRAVEAARTGRTRTVNAASMALTQRRNRYNNAAGRDENTDSGVLFVLDGRYDGIRGTLVKMPLAPADPTRDDAIHGSLQLPAAWPVLRRITKWDMVASHGRTWLALAGTMTGTVHAAWFQARLPDHSTEPPQFIECDSIWDSAGSTLRLTIASTLSGSETWDAYVRTLPGATMTSATETHLAIAPLPKP